VNILGVHIGHDSSAALLKDGHLIADVAEERFNRVKHYSGIPYGSVGYCLKAGSLAMGDIDVVAVSSVEPMPSLNFLFDMQNGARERKNIRSQAIDVYRKYFSSAKKPPIYISKFSLEGQTEIVHVEHHLAHAASAYYTSGLSRSERALIVTCDGAGDGFSLCVWRGENGRIQPLKKFKTDGSIGWFYSNVTEALGWIHGDGEGKTMGLAPYGDFTDCRGVLDSFYPKYATGELVESHSFGPGYYWDENGSLEFHFDEAYDLQTLVQKHGAENIAAEAQRVLEEQVMEVVFPWMEKERTTVLCAAGGVFLNVKLNQRLWYSGKITKQWTYPNPGDSGLAVGCALYAHYQNATNDPIHLQEHLYWGPEYSNEEVAAIVRERSLNAKYVEDVAEEAARLLSQNKILAWFQGRMESGPRALGNRSILMSTAKKENKDIINERVKYREGFRPFCPSMTIEAAADYLVQYRAEPFMITSFDTTERKMARIPAVVHADGTARPQTVRKEINPEYWKLITEFGKLTGDPVLLNTSFNIKGEPIICHPREAIRCFYDSGIDHLVIGNYLFSKE
jgi:carbamoyltransferase